MDPGSRRHAAHALSVWSPAFNCMSRILDIARNDGALPFRRQEVTFWVATYSLPLGRKLAAEHAWQDAACPSQPGPEPQPSIVTGQAKVV